MLLFIIIIKNNILSIYHRPIEYTAVICAKHYFWEKPDYIQFVFYKLQLLFEFLG